MTKKINIAEWIFNKQTGNMEFNRFTQKVKVLYDNQLDISFCKYKNGRPIPLSLDYVKNGTLNILNYEGAFAPFTVFEFEIVGIDSLTTNSKTAEKIKMNLDEVKKIMDLAKKHDHAIKRLERDNKDGKNEKELTKLKDNLTEMKERIYKTAVPKDMMIKACVLPMFVRGFHITQLRRLLRKHAGFFEKYGIYIMFVIALVLFIAYAVIMADTLGDVNLKVIEQLTNGIKDGIVKGMLEYTQKTGGVTTVPKLVPI